MGRPRASRKAAVRRLRGAALDAVRLVLRLSGAVPAAADRSPAESHRQCSAHQAAKTGPRRALRALGFVIVVVLSGVALLTTVLRTFDVDGRPTTVVVASLPFWSLTDDTGIVAAHPGTFTEVSPWVYGLTATGQIAAQAPQRAEETDAATHRLRILGIPLIPSIANVTDGRWAYHPVGTMLHDPAARARHIAGIVTLVKREGYAGVDIDYEDLKATDREAFTTFLTRLGDALHADNKILSVALFAKTTDAGEDQRNIAQDYAAIGAVVDEVRLMGYDYHWNGSQPGAVAPITWIREVLAYAKTQIHPQKILLGIPVAGYDWVDGYGEEVTWQQCFDRTKSFNATVRYNGEHEAPWFRYTDARGREHEVWFENADSTKAKLDAVKASGIRGVYLWMYGGADGRTWDQLRHLVPTNATPPPGTDTAPR
jgi:spore germination protein